MKLSLSLVFAIGFMACSQDGGQRVPINRVSSKTANNNTLSKASDVTSVNADDKKKCLDISKLVQRIRELEQQNFRAYKSDLRILETNGKNPRAHTDQDIQSKLLHHKLQVEQESFYEVDYAKNIVKDVPSQLAPFAITEQKECKSVTVKFLGEDDPKELTIEQDSFTDFYLVLNSDDKKETYVFQRTGNDRLDFTSYTDLQLDNPACNSNSNSSENSNASATHTPQVYFAKSTITYEWTYTDHRPLEVSTTLVNSFKDLLSKTESDPEDAQGLPTSVENSLSGTKHSDTSRIKINAEDYIRMIRHAHGHKHSNSPKCN